MILLDTSIVVEFLRTPNDQVLKLMRQHKAAICGVTWAEVLHGARSDAHLATLTKALNSFAQIDISPGLWEELGHNLFRLRSSGITVPISDALIATVAIISALELWTHDNHFVSMLPILPTLKLFGESP